MVKRRDPIKLGIINRGLNTSPINNSILSVNDILEPITRLSNSYAEDALSRYNADNYAIIQKLPSESDLYSTQYPDATYVHKPIIETSNYRRPNLFKKNKRNYTDGDSFINTIYDSYYKAVRPGATSDTDAARQAKFLAQKAAFETGYGSHLANTHNYGGHKTKDGWLAFNNMDDFTRRDVALLDKKWGNWRNARNESEYIDAINTNNGYGVYAPKSENKDYKGRYMGLSKRVNSILSNRQRRPKAWIGAAIGAATSILGSVLSASAKRKQEEEQRRSQDLQNSLKRAESLNQMFGLTQDAQKEYENRFRLNYNNGGRIKADLGTYIPILGNLAGSLVDEFSSSNNNYVEPEEERTTLRKGGRRRLRNGVSITDGGYAIPIGSNTFLLRGGSHEDINETGQTGIGINVNGKEIEGENGEVVQKKPNEVRIFSDTIGINGNTFADLVQMGYNKDKLFKIQQNMNGDYGRRRMRNGGYLTRPVERIEARLGIRELLRRGYNTVRDSFIGDIWRLANKNIVNTDGATINITDKDGKVHTINIPGVQGGAPNVLPGRVGGFRPQNIERGIRATRNIANKVTQSVRSSIPKNVPKSTKGPKVLNANKGDLTNMAKTNARAEAWVKAKPFEQTGYQGASVVEPNKVNPYTGQIPFYSIGDRLRTAPWVSIGTGAGLGTVSGLAYANRNKGNSYIHMQNEAYIPISPDTTTVENNTTVKNANVKPITTFNNNSYVYGATRGKNQAPYRAIQIGANSPDLGNYNVSTPSLDTTIFGNNFASVGSTPTTSTPSRRTSVGTRSGRSSASSRPSLVTNNSSVSSNTVNLPGSGTDLNIRRSLITPALNATIPTTPIVNNNITPINLPGSGTDPNVRQTLVNNTINGNSNTQPVISQNNRNRLGMVTKGADWIQLGADLIGSLGTTLINSSAANAIENPSVPIMYSPGKLITNWNIAPRLSNVANSRLAMLRDSDEGFSSAGRLARRNQINLTTNNLADTLWGEKTNKEVELLNADALNQQSVHKDNVKAYNAYLKDLAETNTRRNLIRNQALQLGLSGLSDAVGNFIDQGKQRYSDQQAMRYYMALLPEEGRNWLRRNRVDFLRKGGRIK